MASWLESYAPRRFDELAMDVTIQKNLEKVALQANPPHIILAGPPGVGKTAAWRLLARQMLGPSWKSTAHVLQARDLAKTAGAMKKFEEFLRPEGKSSKDTLAGRSSLDSFDANLTVADKTDIPPAGVENRELNENKSLQVSCWHLCCPSPWVLLGRCNFDRILLQYTAIDLFFLPHSIPCKESLQFC